MLIAAATCNMGGSAALSIASSVQSRLHHHSVPRSSESAFQAAGDNIVRGVCGVCGVQTDLWSLVCSRRGLVQSPPSCPAGAPPSNRGAPTSYLCAPPSYLCAPPSYRGAPPSCLGAPPSYRKASGLGASQLFSRLSRSPPSRSRSLSASRSHSRSRTRSRSFGGSLHAPGLSASRPRSSSSLRCRSACGADCAPAP
jgi:hypothetical protein